MAPKAAFVNAAEAPTDVNGGNPADVKGGATEADDGGAVTADDGGTVAADDGGGTIAAVAIDGAVTPGVIEALLPLQKLDGGSIMTVGIV